jgi:hypothetical protein
MEGLHIRKKGRVYKSCLPHVIPEVQADRPCSAGILKKVLEYQRGRRRTAQFTQH